ncbi:hypothetical protein AVEN_60841-1, partial [Araneus ventricosus]
RVTVIYKQNFPEFEAYSQSIEIAYTKRELPFFRLRPRWPSSKVSALGVETPRFETRFHCISVVYWARFTLNHTWVAKRPPIVVVRKFGEWGASTGVVSVTCLRFKIMRSIPK